MNKTLGFGTSAGVVAILAVVLRLAVPTPTKVQEGAGDSHAVAKPSAGSASSGTESLETSHGLDVEGPWLATQAFFHQDPNGVACPKSKGSSGEAPVVGCASSPDLTHLSSVETCARDSGCSQSLSRYFGVVHDSGRPPQIQYIIATVPDPLHTRLALSTDSSLETIEKAAVESHWEFAAQWLPWYDSADAGEKDAEKRRKQRALIKEQESQPGLLVFRHGPVSGGAGEKKSADSHFDNNLLFVFLIGETPTTGINGVAFRIARAYMRAFGDPPEVRIVGPTFSGSYYSLSQLIEGDHIRANQQQVLRALPSVRYVVRTGSATSANAADALKHTPHVDIRVNGIGENSNDHTQHFESVRDGLGIDPRQTAILAEDDTAFSRQFGHSRDNKGHPQETLVLRFPRDISHLRNVYQEANSKSGQESTPSSVEFSLKDTESGEDTVPTFSAAQTPLEQNSVLEYIISELRASRIRLVELAATNVLDALFLAEVLRLQCPDIRLLIDQPDLLFVKAAQTEPLEGVLAISSYPLFPDSRHWSLDQTGSQKPIHESSAAEALYNALGSFLLVPNQPPILNDYAWDQNDRPQTWLLELSRHGFAPVRLLQDRDSSWYYRYSAAVPHASFVQPVPSALWFFFTSAFAAISLVFCSWITRLNRDKYLLVASLAATDGRHIADAYRLMFLFFTLLILAVAQAILYVPLLIGAAPNTLGDKLFHLLSIAGIVVPFGFAVWLLKPIFAAPRVTLARYAYAAFGLAFALLVPGLWYLSCARPEGHTGFFLSMRALEMHVGPSPSLPILLLLAALLIFSVSHLLRFYFLMAQRPRMFTAAIDRFSKGKLRNCRRSMNRILASPMDLSPGRQAAIAFALAAALALLDLLLSVHAKLSSIEGRLYDTITLLLLSMVVAAIVLTACQMKQCWISLQQILIRFHALPLVCFFTPLHTTGKGGPVWARRFDLQSLRIPTASIIVLHNLQVAIKDPSYAGDEVNPEELRTWFDSYRETLGNLIAAKKVVNYPGSGPKEEQMDRAGIRKEFGRLRYQGATISHNLNGSVIVPEWSRTALPWIPPVMDDKTQMQPDCTQLRNQSISEIAQTFVTLQYSMFINYGVRQIQNLLLAVSLGFGLLVVALNVYAFEALHLVNRFLLVGFIGLGVVIWQVMSQMERDPVLSRLSGSTEGELSREFYVKLIGYGALPLVSVLSSQFPSIGHFLSSWVEPSLEAFK
jgi:hypothetical protein